MRQPVWLLNVSVLVLVCAALGFVALYKTKVPVVRKPEPIAPAAAVPAATSAPALDPTLIYTNDLFDTYKKMDGGPKEPEYVKPMPLPPQPIIITAPLPPVPQFLDPLSLTLTGVLLFNDDSKDRAIILDNKTKQELTYKVGDSIEDAQLIKIFANRVLMIRSNGQQETLYLTDELEIDRRETADKKDWRAIVKATGTNNFVIDRQEFIDAVGSLANLVDLFDISSAYINGHSVGSKIGNIDRTSLAYALGFRAHDIVESINGIAATDTTARLKIYNNITALADGGQIKVAVKRSEAPKTLIFTLGTINLPPEKKAVQQAPATTPDQARLAKQADRELEQKQIDLIKQKEKFAPTLQDIRLQEKKNVLMHQKKRLNPRAALGKDQLGKDQ